MEEATPTGGEDEIVAIGTVLADRYRIDGVIGTGGMGRVYRGEHTAMGKPVAIKVLHAALGRNQEAGIRFQREAVASGRLDHPNIVNVTDFGVLENGALYLVMELLEGESLGQRLAREKRIPWSDALAIMRGVLLGLRHAHDRGVVHRDIKPDNIFLANKDGEGVVKILDFGIAKLYAGNLDDQNATRAGLTVGTPKYLSPEQAVGGAITPACDVYSASVVLFEMLVGRAPFEAEDALALLSSHAGADVPRFEELAPDLEVPDGLEALVRHGLEKIIADRIDSTLDYVHEIDDLLRTHGIDVPVLSTAPPPSLGIPVGPHALAPSNPGRTPPAGVLRASASFLSSTPLPFSVTQQAPTPRAPTVEAPPAKEPARATPVAARPPAKETPATTSPAPRPPAPRRRRGWIAVAALALIAAIAGAIVWLSRGDTPAPTVASKPPAKTTPKTAPAKPAPAKPPATAQSKPATTPTPPPKVETRARGATPRPSTAAADREKQLAAALDTLQTGASCAARKKAIAKLVALHDRAAIPALRRAAARKPNACLRAAANQAIKSISAK